MNEIQAGWKATKDTQTSIKHLVENDVLLLKTAGTRKEEPYYGK